MASIADEFEDRVGFLTILIDFEYDRDAATQVIDAYHVHAITVEANESVFESFGEHFTSGYIPESILIDGEGNILANIVGGTSDDYRLAIETALND